MDDKVNAETPVQRVRQPDRLGLFNVATGQAGYFTSEQARRCGFSRALMTHYAKTGRFIHIRRGLYRFREYPSSPREHVMAAWLAVGKDIAVVSHESALDLLDLSDVIPNSVQLTVPRSRRNLPSLPGVKIHTSSRPLRPSDLAYREGMVVTSATRTILDAAETGTAPEQIELAVVQATRRGLALPDVLQREAAGRSQRVASLVERALSLVAA